MNSEARKVFVKRGKGSTCTATPPTNSSTVPFPAAQLARVRSFNSHIRGTKKTERFNRE